MKLLQYRSLTYCIALGIAVATTIFGFRFWAIFNYGLELPLNDEWYSEWHTLYAPYLSGTLTASEFMLRNDVHNIALQKCLQLVVFALAGEWNPTLLMVLNASLFSLFCGMLAAAAARVIETARSSSDSQSFWSCWAVCQQLWRIFYLASRLHGVSTTSCHS